MANTMAEYYVNTRRDQMQPGPRLDVSTALNPFPSPVNEENLAPPAAPAGLGSPAGGPPISIGATGAGSLQARAPGALPTDPEEVAYLNQEADARSRPAPDLSILTQNKMSVAGAPESFDDIMTEEAQMAPTTKDFLEREQIRDAGKDPYAELYPEMGIPTDLTQHEYRSKLYPTLGAANPEFSARFPEFGEMATPELIQELSMIAADAESRGVNPEALMTPDEVAVWQTLQALEEKESSTSARLLPQRQPQQRRKRRENRGVAAPSPTYEDLGTLGSGKETLDKLFTPR